MSVVCGGEHHTHWYTSGKIGQDFRGSTAWVEGTQKREQFSVFSFSFPSNASSYHDKSPSKAGYVRSAATSDMSSPALLSPHLALEDPKCPPKFVVPSIYPSFGLLHACTPWCSSHFLINVFYCWISFRVFQKN